MHRRPPIVSLPCIRSSLVVATIVATLVSRPLAAQRGEAAKPDYSAPSGAPYTAIDVVVPTPMGHKLAGTLTLPKSASNAHPVGAIVTITGSGPQDRDESLGFGDYRPFRQYADTLGRRGIAVLRMDDRGTAASGGTFKGATSADFAEDIRAGLAYLRTRRDIDSTRLGLLGHSEGAIVAPIAASKEPNLRALVLLAGVARPAREVLVFQMKNLINHNDKLSQTQKDSATAAIPSQIEKMMAADPWMAYFLVHDPSATARQIKTPAVLILTGSNDQQADPKQIPDWMAAFIAAGNTDVTGEILPGLDHLFVVDPDGFPGNYTKLPAPLRVDSRVLGLVADWVSLRFK